MRRLTLVAILVAALGLVPSAAAWTWPLGGDVLRPYSLGPDAYAAGQHRGVDVAGVDGEPVRAPASGTISFAGVVPGSGRTITVQLDGYAVSVTHLGEISVAKGATVAEGQTIGSAGQSGEVEWPTPYVHLGIRVSAAADGYVDPATLLPPRAAVPPPSGAPVAAPVPVATPVVTPVPGPVPAPIVPVVTPVAAPVVTPIAVPVVVPTVIPTVAPAPVQVSPSRPAPRSARPQAPGPVVAVDSRQAPVAADSPRPTVSSGVPPVLAVGQPTIASDVVSTAVQTGSGVASGAASTAQRPLGGTGRVSLHPGPQVGASSGPEARAVGSLPDALVAPGAAGSDAMRAANARSGTGVEPGERNPGIVPATATRSAANGVSADGSPTVADRLTSRIRGGVAAAGPIDRGTTAPPLGVPKQAAETDSGTTARDGSATIETMDVIQRGRRLVVAAAALLLVALGTIWLLARLGRGDDDGRRPGRGQARLGRRGGVVVAGVRGSDRGRL